MCKVLVIDDYTEHADTLVETLIKYGAQAEAAYDAASGITALMSERYDLLICDGLLEGRRAWKLLHEYMQVISDNQNIFISPDADKPYCVALTGFGSVLQRRLCEEVGYHEYVTKPIELSTLLGWVQKARARAEARE